MQKKRKSPFTMTPLSVEAPSPANRPPQMKYPSCGVRRPSCGVLRPPRASCGRPAASCSRPAAFRPTHLEQLSAKVVSSVDSKSTDLSRAGNWCFETETEEPTNQPPHNITVVLLLFHIWRGRSISVRFWGKNRGFGTVGFHFTTPQQSVVTAPASAVTK